MFFVCKKWFSFFLGQMPNISGNCTHITKLNILSEHSNCVSPLYAKNETVGIKNGEKTLLHSSLLYQHFVRLYESILVTYICKTLWMRAYVARIHVAVSKLCSCRACLCMTDATRTWHLARYIASCRPGQYSTVHCMVQETLSYLTYLNPFHKCLPNLELSLYYLHFGAHFRT